MDDKSLKMLEFPKIRDILAGFTSFSASRYLATSLQPSSNPEMVSRLLKQSTEARHIFSSQPQFSIDGVQDIRELVQIAARGKVLEPLTLISVQTTIAAARNLRRNLEKLAQEVPFLWSIARQIVELPGLEEKIGRCITPSGELLDTASIKLANTRYQLKEKRQQLLLHLEDIIKSPHTGKLIQESLITEREGRFVIPVKVEKQREIKGIIHDISGSGATVFIEPWAAVEMGNDLRTLVLEERREVERILADLSLEAGASEAVISQNVALIAELDLILAKARYAEKVKATEPLITTIDANGRDASHLRDNLLRFVNARHPLLKGKAVPLSVEIGRDFSILIITGPNTGGKTVALKTIGLLALMTQSGIPIPASETSCVPIFDSIFADIGDEQSIEQTLSTFGWHMGNTVRIIQNSTERSLVLLDELGTSTDPNEGAALARAILLHFLSRGTMVVTTTHYSDLKLFGHTTPGLRNASLDFNPTTLAPTYHLTVGIPGGSNALAMASQLGLSPNIVASAKDMLARDTQEIESLLRDLTGEKERVTSLRNELEKEISEAQDQKRHLEGELQKLKEQERNILQEARDKLVLDTAELQKQIRQAASELRKIKSRENIEQARKVLTSVHKELASQVWQPDREESRRKEGRAYDISPGDKVWLKDIGLWGIILAIHESSNQIEVQLKHSKLRLNREDIEKVGPPEDTVSSEAVVVVKGLISKRSSIELDLRGKRADEVAPELDSYLNDAFLARFNQVRIIHGVATGTVRQIVRDMLGSHSLVKSFRSGEKGEGGSGVTIVKL